MLFEQQIVLDLPADAVWQAFHDIELLVQCLPGASLDAGKPATDEGIPLVFRVKLGPIGASFAGRGRIELDEAGRGGTFSGGAVDQKANSRVKGEAKFSVREEGEGTVVALQVDYTMTGMLAQFSREGIVRAVADTLTKQFAANLKTRLTAGAAPDGGPDNSSLSLWTVVKTTIKRPAEKQ